MPHTVLLTLSLFFLWPLRSSRLRGLNLFLVFLVSWWLNSLQ